jgi:hypothetical protein
MTVLDEGLEYYLITLTADDDAKSIISTQTEWIGYADEARRVEVRQPSLVRPGWFLEMCAKLGWSCLVVKNDDQWPLFWLLGGHALVEEGVAQRALPTTFSRDECVRTGELGFTSIASLPEGARNRAPKPRLRMTVFN